MPGSTIVLTWTKACSEAKVTELLRGAAHVLTLRALDAGAEVRDLHWYSYPDYTAPGYGLTVRW